MNTTPRCLQKDQGFKPLRRESTTWKGLHTHVSWIIFNCMKTLSFVIVEWLQLDSEWISNNYQFENPASGEKTHCLCHTWQENAIVLCKLGVRNSTTHVLHVTQIPCWVCDMFDSKENKQERQTLAHTPYHCVKYSGWHWMMMARNVCLTAHWGQQQWWHRGGAELSTVAQADELIQTGSNQSLMLLHLKVQSFVLFFFHLYLMVNLMCRQETLKMQFNFNVP